MNDSPCCPLLSGDVENNAMRAESFSISFADTLPYKDRAATEKESGIEEGEVKVTGDTRGLLTRGYQVQDAFPVLKVEFNCWCKFRREGRIHMLLQRMLSRQGRRVEERMSNDIHVHGMDLTCR